jgi:hypothetical protein
MTWDFLWSAAYFSYALHATKTKAAEKQSAKEIISFHLSHPVMAGLVPATHEHPCIREIMGPRHKAGDDDTGIEVPTVG